MSGFLTGLDVALVQDADACHARATWRLCSPLVYHSDWLGRDITVPAGFVTDFASVPRIPLAWLLAGGESNEAATVHDYLYHSHEVPRATADAVFEEAMAATGQGWLIRKGAWAMVRIFGGSPYADDYETKGDTP